MSAKPTMDASRALLFAARSWCLRAFAVVAIALSQIACGASPWQPPVPQGQTYQYDYQGFRASDTTVAAGTNAFGPTYAGVFAFRKAKGVHAEAGGKDPFSQSARIDGYRFNDHLPGQGARLLPSAKAAIPASAGVDGQGGVR